MSRDELRDEGGTGLSIRSVGHYPYNGEGRSPGAIRGGPGPVGPQAVDLGLQGQVSGPYRAAALLGLLQVLDTEGMKGRVRTENDLS